MYSRLFILDYVLWHYTRAVRDGSVIGLRLLGFMVSYFGIWLHLRTLFARFERMGEQYPKSAWSSEYFTAVAVNTVMRLVGAVIRLFVVSVGLVAVLGSGVIAIGMALVWILLPVVLFGLVIIGILLMLGV